MLLTYKTRIEPTPAQRQVLWELSEQCRLLYNFALQERLQWWQQERHKPKALRNYLTYVDQQNALPQLKTQFPQFRWVYSKVLQLVLRTLDANFKSFFGLRKKGDPKAKPPRFKGKQYFTTLKYNQSGFQLREGILTLSHKHPSQVVLAFRLPYLPAGTIKQVELYYEPRTRHWFVAFNCQVELPAYFDNGLYQAFDTGIENLVSAVNSQGKFLQIPNRRPDKYWRRKLAAVQAKRDHCKRFSRKWHWYQTKLYRMRRKLTNQLKDWQHKISKVVVTHTKANTLIFGQPAVKHMAQQAPPPRRNQKAAHSRKGTNTLHYALQNTGSMSRFIEFVAYKAKKVGKRVIRIDEAYTTQICPKCGQLEAKSLSQRRIVCVHCGYQQDRDLASALNLLARFYLQKEPVETLWQEPSVNEESFFLRWKGFLRQTAQGKTKVSLSSYWRRFGGLVGSPGL